MSLPTSWECVVCWETHIEPKKHFLGACQSVLCGCCKKFVDKHSMEKMGENDIAVLERSMMELSLVAEDSDDEPTKYKMRRMVKNTEYMAFQKTRSDARLHPYY